MDSAEILRRYRRLFSSLISDAAEEIGLPTPALDSGLEPFHVAPLRVAVGFAFPCRVQPTNRRAGYGRLLEMVDAVPSSSMVVMAVDAPCDAALWGGLMTTSVKARGAVGAVVDGGIRDLHQVQALDFGVWAAFRSPLGLDGRGEVVGHGDAVTCRGRTVAPGDLVFADANGVVVVPRHAAEDVLEACERRERAEDVTARELAAGQPATRVYEQFGVI